MNFLLDLITTPATALWAALAFPFAARYFVAWTVLLRIRGYPPGAANIQPRRAKSDYPSPNDVVSAAVIFGVAIVAAWLLAAVSNSILSLPAGPFWLWPALFLGSALGSMLWVIRRVHADDQRQKILLVERLTEGSIPNQD